MSKRSCNISVQGVVLATTLFAIMVTAVPRVVLTVAHAETRVTGEPRELSVEAYDTNLQEVLAALSASFALQYRTSADLNRSMSGTYKGSLREVIARILHGYDFFVRNSGNEVVIVVVGLSGAEMAEVPPKLRTTSNRDR